MINKAPIGIAPLTWSNDDKPEIGKENTFAQCISEMALAGYAGCELGGKFPTDIELLKSELELRGLQTANQWFSFEATLKDTAAVKEDFLRHVAKLRTLGTKVVGGGEFGSAIVSSETTPVLSRTEQRTILNAEQWKTFASRIEELGKIAHEEGLALSFHPHLGTCVQTAAETERLLHDCDSRYVSLNYDCGHFFCAGEDPTEVLQRFVSRVRHIHLKNVRPDVLATTKATDRSFLGSVMAGLFTIPGDPAGCIDFLPLFKILDAADYAGWLIVEAEQDPAKAHPLKTAITAREYLRQAIGH